MTLRQSNCTVFDHVMANQVNGKDYEEYDDDHDCDCASIKARF